MTRLARLVVPGLPHHVTQRGNRREAIFFEDGDHEIYRDLLAEQTRKASVEVWAYCLMPNHVHLMTPETADGLGRAVGEAHRRYTNFINARGPLERPSVPEPLRLRGHGRGSSDGGGALCQPEPSQGEAGPARRGLAMVECPRPSGGRGRRTGHRAAGAGAGALFRQAAGRRAERGVRRVEASGGNRAAGRGGRSGRRSSSRVSSGCWAGPSRAGRRGGNRRLSQRSRWICCDGHPVGAIRTIPGDG